MKQQKRKATKKYIKKKKKKKHYINILNLKKRAKKMNVHFYKVFCIVFFFTLFSKLRK